MFLGAKKVTLSGPFGAQVAHGALIYSLAVGLASQIDDFVRSKPMFREVVSWVFRTSVFLNDSIRVRLCVFEAKPIERLHAAKVIFSVAVSANECATVATGQWVLMIPMRPAA